MYNKIINDLEELKKTQQREIDKIDKVLNLLGPKKEEVKSTPNSKFIQTRKEPNEVIWTNKNLDKKVSLISVLKGDTTNIILNTIKENQKFLKKQEIAKELLASKTELRKIPKEKLLSDISTQLSTLRNRNLIVKHPVGNGTNTKWGSTEWVKDGVVII